MIIDDELDNLQLVKDILQFTGFETYDFNNPQLALDVFKQDPTLYDLVIMDIMMEEMDGRFLYKEMKRLSSKTNMLVFTALDLDVNEFIKICPSFNEKHLVRKPVTMDSLLKKVNQVLNDQTVLTLH